MQNQSFALRFSFLDFTKLKQRNNFLKQRFARLNLDLSKSKQRFAKGIVLTLIANLCSIALAGLYCLSYCLFC